jgi:hypothetical protein
VINIELFVKTLVLVVIVLTTIWYHELAHKRIFETYGCEDISMGLSWDSAFVTANCPIKVMDDVNRDNNFNEVIGYNIATPLLLLTAVYISRM